MKKILAAAFFAAAFITGCKKEIAEPAPAAGEAGEAAASAAASPGCGTKYLNLVVDPSTGQSLLYVVYNTPSNPPVTVVNINGSAGNNIIGSSSLSTTVTFMTGLSFDPNTSICYGITGGAGSHPHSLVTFNVGDPNVVTITPLVSFSRINLSDIERNPWNGRYYAINRASGINNRIVDVNVGSGAVTNYPSGTGLGSLRGLAMDPGGKLYVSNMIAGGNGDIYVVDPLTGGLILGPCAYPGAIAPGVLGTGAEMGLHFDDVCTNLLVTGNYTGVGTLLTDGLPVCLGGPSYTSIPSGVKPTVDFARLN